VDETLPSISTKQELIAYTTDEWNALVTYVDSLPAGQWSSPTDAAGWSVKDHVSHLTQWDRAVIALLRHQVPLKESLGISDTTWAADSYDPMNDEIRQRALHDPVQQVKADRDATWADLVALLGELNEELLAQPSTEAGLAVGTRPLNDSIHAGSVLQVLVEWCGGSYAEHLRYIKALVQGQPA